ncbi:MAG: SAM-dependent methyltransferase [Anaerolineaceae bacterium]|nr:SAM-dependent methyltransferase [Anaerolineaceae bacterium]
MIQKSSLYIVATSIGHPEDITLRALNILSQVDGVICEEYRRGSTVLKRIGISPGELLTLNEHNEREQVPEIIQQLHQGKSFALISDGGTPVFADPGYHLIEWAVKAGVTVIPVPGPSSLMAALSILDFKLDKFIFGGFLSRKSDTRIIELQGLKNQKIPIILMDTPYRLGKLLHEVKSVFGKNQIITLSCDLTLSTETIYRGMISDVQNRLGERKAEFILIIHTPKNSSR